MTPIEYYTHRFPQLALGIKNGMRETEEYKQIVSRGVFPESPAFPYEESGNEEIIKIFTPVGTAELLYLPDRKIFEYFIRVLAYRCDDAAIPASLGAMLISGIICWPKIFEHRHEFLKDHDISEWNDEFKRFTSDKENYTETVLLVSRGNYSNTTCEAAGFAQDEWLDISKEIRIYHEISHLISRKLYPGHKEAIRDEVIADSVGIYHALKKYDPELARKVLGIKDGQFTPGGRLAIYASPDKIDAAVPYCLGLIEKLDAFYKEKTGEPFDLLRQIEELYIK